ncbi:hypothetical protein NPIL_437941, partial [Nephila pilipes]
TRIDSICKEALLVFMKRPQLRISPLQGTQLKLMTAAFSYVGNKDDHTIIAFSKTKN